MLSPEKARGKNAAATAPPLDTRCLRNVLGRGWRERERGEGEGGLFSSSIFTQFRGVPYCTGLNHKERFCIRGSFFGRKLSGLILTFTQRCPIRTTYRGRTKCTL